MRTGTSLLFQGQNAWSWPVKRDLALLLEEWSVCHDKGVSWALEHPHPPIYYKDQWKTSDEKLLSSQEQVTCSHSSHFIPSWFWMQKQDKSILCPFLRNYYISDDYYYPLPLGPFHQGTPPPAPAVPGRSLKSPNKWDYHCADRHGVLFLLTFTWLIRSIMFSSTFAASLFASSFSSFASCLIVFSAALLKST